MKRMIVLLVSAWIVSGCGIGPEEYSDFRATEVYWINQTTFSVEGLGARTVPDDKVLKFALLRSAEVTLRKKRQKFRILDRTKKKSYQEYRGSYHRRLRYTLVTLKVTVGTSEEAEASGDEWYDAQKVVDKLGPELKNPNKRDTSTGPKSSN